jgi:hypothetical protein
MRSERKKIDLRSLGKMDQSSPERVIPAVSSPSAVLVPVTTSNARLGMVVSRGPDWRWGDQDGGSFGTIERVVPADPRAREGTVGRDECVFVRWAATGPQNRYRIGSDADPLRACDLVIGTTPMVALDAVVFAPDVQAALDARKGQAVTLALAPRGAIVTPGPDWCFKTDGKDFVGRIVRVDHAKSTCLVRWSNGMEGQSRVATGPDSFQELVYGDVRTPYAWTDAAPATKRKVRWLQGRGVCADIAARRMLVSRGPDWFKHHRRTGGGHSGVISRVAPNKTHVFVVWTDGIAATMHRLFNPSADSYATDLVFGPRHFTERPLRASRPLPRGVKAGELVTFDNFKRGAPATCGAAFPFCWPEIRMTLLRVEYYEDPDFHTHKIVLRAANGREAAARWGEVIFGDARPTSFIPPPITCPLTVARLEALKGKPVTLDCVLARIHVAVPGPGQEQVGLDRLK